MPDQNILRTGLVLHTKDGRKMGNAIIIGHFIQNAMTVYVCVTDFGNLAQLTLTEIETLFWYNPNNFEIQPIEARFTRQFSLIVNNIRKIKMINQYMKSHP
jgi:hypothetical protein